MSCSGPKNYRNWLDCCAAKDEDKYTSMFLNLAMIFTVIYAVIYSEVALATKAASKGLGQFPPRLFSDILDSLNQTRRPRCNTIDRRVEVLYRAVEGKELSEQSRQIFLVSQAVKAFSLVLGRHLDTLDQSNDHRSGIHRNSRAFAET